MGVTLIKQLWTAQHKDMFNPVKQEVINDMYNSIIQQNFNGVKEINTKVLDYEKNPSENP